MNKISQLFLGTAASFILGATVLLTPGTSRAQTDCSSIAACVVPTIANPALYDPAFQVNITDLYHVEMDLFSDASCGVLYDTVIGDGTGTGLMTFEYSLNPPLNAGDTMSLKARVGWCPETACLQVVGGQGICQGF